MVLFSYIQYTEMQYWFGSGSKYEDKINEHWHYIKEIGGEIRSKMPTLIYDTQALFIVSNILKQSSIETFIPIK